jgi:hypothetical protein
MTWTGNGVDDVSRRTYVFVSSDGSGSPDGAMGTIEDVLGRSFVREPGADPWLRADPVAVYVGGHDFDDGDIDFPDGAPVPLRSRYPYLVEIRDTEKDQGRQAAAAAAIYAALTADRSRTVVLIDDMQHVVQGGGAG